jgi:hypothetical protein
MSYTHEFDEAAMWSDSPPADTLPRDVMAALLDDAEILRPEPVEPEQLEAPRNSPKLPEKRRFTILRPDDLRGLAPIRWRVKGVLPAAGLAAIYGPSASGKSFLAFDMAGAIADGEDWFGYRVNAAPVLYLPLEGEAGFRLRAAAWEIEHGRELPEGVALTMDEFKLTDPQDVRDLADAAGEMGAEPVIIIDTLNRAAPEADENSSADMGRILEGAKQLQRLTGGLVVLVHHTGKDATRGLRGHSSLFAALDGVIEVTRDGENRAWKVGKAKDGEDGKEHPFRLKIHNMGEDEDGDPVTSCAITRDTSAADIKRAKLPTGGNQKLVYGALGKLFKAPSVVHGKADAPPLRACIELDAAVLAGASAMTCAADRRTERARSAITGLVSRGVLACRDGWLWHP